MSELSDIVEAAKVAGQFLPQTIEKPQFAERAVFEAIVNAVAHRDYSIQQSCIRLHMFADRFRIFILSVQKEFAKERRLLAEYICKEPYAVEAQVGA